MFQRRDLLKWVGAGGIAVAFGPRTALGQSENADPAPLSATAPVPTEVPANPPNFHQGVVRAQAKALAAQPYTAPVADLPDPFRQLSPDFYQGIRRRDSALIWRTSDSHFIVEPLLRGPLYTTQVDINLAVGDQVSSVPCVNDDYDFGAIKLPTKSFTLVFSGFRILQKAAEGPAVEIAKFQGASLFRTKAI